MGGEPGAPGSFKGFEENPDGPTVWPDAANAKFSFYQDWDEAEATSPGWSRRTRHRSGSVVSDDVLTRRRGRGLHGILTGL